MKISSSLHLDLFLLTCLIGYIAAMTLEIMTPEELMEERKKRPLMWKGNEELPIELKDGNVDFSHVPEFECILGSLCQIQIRALLNESEIPTHSNVEIVALYNGLGLALSKTNTSLVGIPLKHGIKKFILKFTTDDGTLARVPFAVYVPEHSLPKGTHAYHLSLSRPKRLSCQVSPGQCVQLFYMVSYAANIPIQNLTFSIVREKIRGSTYVEFYDHSYPTDVCLYGDLHQQHKRIISREGIQEPTKEFKSRLGDKYIIESVFFGTDMPCFNFELNDQNPPAPNPNAKEEKFDLKIDLGTIVLH